MSDAAPKNAQKNTQKNDAARLTRYVDAWRAATADFIALARTIPQEQWTLPTDLDGWNVIDNVAHTAHLEAVLAGAPEETIEVTEASHIKGLTGWYTEQGVLARRGRHMSELLSELEAAVAVRTEQLETNPPTDGDAAPPKTPGDIGWSTEVLLRNRPLDVWMHEQDIRRAIGRPGGFDSPAAKHTIWLLSMSLPIVVGKRVAPPAGTTVVVRVPDARLNAGVTIGEDGRAHPTEVTDDATVTITLDPEAWIMLAGGRRPANQIVAQIDGDRALGAQVLDAMAITP